MGIELILLFGALALGAFIQEAVVPDVRRRWVRWQQQRKADKNARWRAEMEVMKARIRSEQPPARHYDATQAAAVLSTCSSCGREFFMTHVNERCVRCRGGKAS